MKYALLNRLKKLLLFTLLLSLCFSALSCAGREVRQDKEIGNLYRTYVLWGSSRTIDSIQVIPPYQYNDYRPGLYQKTYEVTKSDDINTLLRLIKEAEPSLTAVENDGEYFDKNMNSYKTPEGLKYSAHCWVDIRVDGKQRLVVLVAKQGIAFFGNSGFVCFESDRDLSDVMNEMISIGETGELIPNALK